MDDNYKEVNFEKYCGICKFKELPAHYDPCDECLAYGVNSNSEKPVYWKEEGDN